VVVVIVMITRRGIVNRVCIPHVMIGRLVALWIPNFTLSCRNETFAENLDLQRYYAASSGNNLPTFLGNLSVPFSGLTMRMGPIACSETSVTYYQYSLRNNPEERSSQLLRGGSLKSRKEHSLYRVARDLFVKWKGGKYIELNVKYSGTRL
jgi:hypothetical protein